jgi:hypothetical protein
MNPFLETLAQILALFGGLAGVGAMFWGAARRQRGREAVDEQHATKIAALTSSSDAHASKCDDDHRAHRDERAKLDRRLVKVETKLEALE